MDSRHKDFSGEVMYGVDLRGHQLYGAKFRLVCEQFDGVKLDEQQVALLVLMLSEAEFDKAFRDRLHVAVRESLGEQQYRVLCAYLKVA